MGTPINPKLCVTLLQQNAHLLYVNCAFDYFEAPTLGIIEASFTLHLLNRRIASVASLDFEIIRSLQ